MSLANEVRLFAQAFSNQDWPQFLAWIEIEGIRGWTGQRIDFQFPIVAVVGKNGAGKSTVIQAAAVGYKSDNKERYASDFFPDTPFEKVQAATIRYGYKIGQNHHEKPLENSPIDGEVIQIAHLGQ